MNIDRAQIEEIVRKIVTEKLSVKKSITPDGLVSIDLPAWDVSEDDRMDTGNPTDQVYTNDL